MPVKKKTARARVASGTKSSPKPSRNLDGPVPPLMKAVKAKGGKGKERLRTITTTKNANPYKNPRGGNY